MKPVASLGAGGAQELNRVSEVDLIKAKKKKKEKEGKGGNDFNY